MEVVAAGLAGVAVIAVAFAITCYYQLWRWARMCQHARITAAYKGKVKVDAPIVEWLLWCNQLKGDQASNGRVILAAGGVSLAILRPTKYAYGPLAALRRIRRRRLVAPRQGAWQAKDQTKQKSQLSQVTNSKGRA